MPRKSWDELSPGYRSRLERAGIDARSHASGAGLSKARGHKSTEYEREQRQSYSVYDRWIKESSRMYNRDPDTVKAELAEYDRKDIIAGIRLQKEMQALYQDGREREARLKWETRDTSLPDWMFYYHGYFS